MSHRHLSRSTEGRTISKKRQRKSQVPIFRSTLDNIKTRQKWSGHVKFITCLPKETPCPERKNAAGARAHTLSEKPFYQAPSLLYPAFSSCGFRSCSHSQPRRSSAGGLGGFSTQASSFVTYQLGRAPLRDICRMKLSLICNVRREGASFLLECAMSGEVLIM